MGRAERREREKYERRHPDSLVRAPEPSFALDPSPEAVLASLLPAGAGVSPLGSTAKSVSRVRAEVVRAVDDADVRGVIRQLVGARAEAESLLALNVQRARAQGLSWTDIGFALGVSRQSARAKYAATIPPPRSVAK